MFLRGKANFFYQILQLSRAHSQEVLWHSWSLQSLKKQRQEHATGLIWTKNTFKCVNLVLSLCPENTSVLQARRWLNKNYFPWLILTFCKLQYGILLIRCLQTRGLKLKQIAPCGKIEVLAQGVLYSMYFSSMTRLVSLLSIYPPLKDG